MSRWLVESGKEFLYGGPLIATSVFQSTITINYINLADEFAQRDVCSAVLPEDYNTASHYKLNIRVICYIFTKDTWHTKFSNSALNFAQTLCEDAGADILSQKNP